MADAETDVAGEVGSRNLVMDFSQYKTSKEFLADQHKWSLIMGPVGSGKSTTCCAKMIQLAQTQKPGIDGIRRARFLVLRNTVRQLQDTTIQTFLKWFPSGVYGTWQESKLTYIMDAFPGLRIEFWFRALDRPDQIGNLLSMEITGAWVNEAREVPFPIIKAIDSRCGRYPDIQYLGWHGMIFDTNPPEEDSDIHNFFEIQRIEDPKAARKASLFKQPPGALHEIDEEGRIVILGNNPEAENVDHLPPDYYTDMAVGATQDFIKVYILNRYGFAVDGKPVFPDYDEKRHYNEKITEPPKGLQIYRGWDFGLTPSVEFAVLTAKGQLQFFDEIVSSDMGAERFADEVILHCSDKYPNAYFVDVGDPSGDYRKDTDERTCFDILKGKGINIQPCKSGNGLALRLDSMRHGLLNTVDGRNPRMVVGPKCKQLHRGMLGGYHYPRRKASGGSEYHKEPEKNNYSHPNDAAQYVAVKVFGDLVMGRKNVGRRDVKLPGPPRGLMGGGRR